MQPMYLVAELSTNPLEELTTSTQCTFRKVVKMLYGRSVHVNTPHPTSHQYSFVPTAMARYIQLGMKVNEWTSNEVRLIWKCDRNVSREYVGTTVSKNSGTQPLRLLSVVWLDGRGCNSCYNARLCANVVIGINRLRNRGIICITCTNRFFRRTFHKV